MLYAVFRLQHPIVKGDHSQCEHLQSDSDKPLRSFLPWLQSCFDAAYVQTYQSSY